MTAVRELRLDWGFAADEQLVLDAVLIQDDGDGRARSQTLCSGAVVWGARSRAERGFTAGARAWLFGRSVQAAVANPGDLGTGRASWHGGGSCSPA